MIRSVADLLRELMTRERAVLDAVKISHRPTIGDMYEGLSQELLERAVPPQLGLQVVRGFISDGSVGLSGQIDCMLVQGAGTPIPYSDSHVWHVSNVLAVFEIKKTLYGSELKEAFEHLNEVRDVEKSYNRTLAGRDEKIDIRTALRAFAETTKTVAPPLSELSALPWHRQIIFHTLVGEHTGPLRIIIGFHGFKSEHNFRKALYEYLYSNLRTPGFGVGNFPQLVVSGDYSLVKANGQPYSSPLIEDDWWPFYFSTAVNPVLLLLEIIWTRLDRIFGVGGLWGEDLELEVPHAFLLAKGGRDDAGNPGWHYQWVNSKPSNLRELGDVEDWQPATLTIEQYAIVTMLCRGRAVRFDEAWINDFLDEHQVSDKPAFWGALLDTGLVAGSSDGSELVLITRNCQTAILPDGRYVAAENNTGRLTRWIRDRYPTRLDAVDLAKGDDPDEG